MNDILELASELAEEGDRNAARLLILELLQEAPRFAPAWQALTELAANDSERRKAIYQFWALEPQNPEANFLLDKLKTGHLAPINNQAALGSRKHYSIPEAPKRSYLHAAILTSFAYLFAWPIGIILNIFFLISARHQQRKLGIEPKYLGCLWLLAFFGFCFTLLLGGFAFLALNLEA